ncbi:hypothetical protein I3842_13G016400 [Carya illinoinensis]|uniref:NAC domain-containing protein n=1 Tax=Carya illinoinensis TaxID=32201 RepID=A0A922AJD3_CARIL|nr:hypothetical protein I3842_13G016400 [Carya illinoinensis]
MTEDGWVVCRVFKKKNFQKAAECPKTSSISMDSTTQIEGVLDQILLYMGRNCKPEDESFSNISISNVHTNNMMFLSTTAKHTSPLVDEELHDRFLHLPRLESPSLPSLAIGNSPFDHDHSFKACYQPFDHD